MLPFMIHPKYGPRSYYNRSEYSLTKLASGHSTPFPIPVCHILAWPPSPSPHPYHNTDKQIIMVYCPTEDMATDISSPQVQDHDPPSKPWTCAGLRGSAACCKPSPIQPMKTAREKSIKNETTNAQDY